MAGTLIALATFAPVVGAAPGGLDPSFAIGGTPFMTTYPGKRVADRKGTRLRSTVNLVSVKISLHLRSGKMITANGATGPAGPNAAVAESAATSA